MLHDHPLLRRRAPRAAAVCALALALGLSACGSSGSSTTTAAGGGQGPGARGGFAALTPKVRACLKKKGVTLPTAGQRPNGGAGGAPPSGGQGAPPQGAPPQGGNGAPPNGGPPAGGTPPQGGGAQAKKMAAAMTACGVTFPTGGPQGAGGAQTTTASQR